MNHEQLKSRYERVIRRSEETCKAARAVAEALNVQVQEEPQPQEKGRCALIVRHAMQGKPISYLKPTSQECSLYDSIRARC